MRRLVAATAVSALLLTACASGDGTTAAGAPEGSSPAASAPARAGQLLARYGLAGKDAVQVVDHLDRMAVADRPTGLTASVRVGHLAISDGAQAFDLALPDDRFYLSVAPYVIRTHECFYHSLTTCKGELAGEEIGVRVVDETDGAVLVDTTLTTFDNGFVGLWLPRDMRGTLRVTYDGKAGRTVIATGDDAPTCLTSLRIT